MAMERFSSATKKALKCHEAVKKDTTTCLSVAGALLGEDYIIIKGKMEAFDNKAS